MVDLLELFSGLRKSKPYESNQFFSSVRSKRIIIATHMHAGDGNNHVNIPVFSNDRKMMKRAEKTAEDIMTKKPLSLVELSVENTVIGHH